MVHGERQARAEVFMSSIRAIYRYPIKGLSPQPLQGIRLEAGKPFPFDRVFALVRPGMPVQVEAPRWAKKGLFLMLMLDEGLARVHTHLDPDSLKLIIHGGASAGGASDAARPLLAANLATPAGRSAVESFFRDRLPALAAAPKLVRAVDDGHFMDKPDSVMSCINLATVRSLEALWGRSMHPLRFRANFYIDGVAPWAEFGWIGREILLGDVWFRVDRRNGRCGATNVDPVSGERDMDIPSALRESFGHKDLGVYLVARNAGEVLVGDAVKVPASSPASSRPAPKVESPAEVDSSAKAVPPASAPLGAGSFICRGCYYIYDELGTPPKAPFASLGDEFRCPDCGTDRSNFRPHVGGAPEPASSAAS
jgi:GntR family transcriptional regulator/MocR family aminotransferase